MNQEPNIQIAKQEQLIKKGLERSCESLAFFLKEKVELETLDYSVTELHVLQGIADFKDKDIILHSEIIGQYGGQCYFLLNRSEANLLFSKNVPNGDPEGAHKLIFEALLLEMDNIITASVVTEFSNYLKIKIFGGVPGIFFSKDKSKLEEILMKMDTSSYSFGFNCRYKIHGIEFSPRFLWALDSKFPDLIQLKSED